VRETEAEAVAFVVSEAIGLEAMRSSSEYISLYSGDKELLTEFLEHIQRASAEIITAITSPGLPPVREALGFPSPPLVATVGPSDAPMHELRFSFEP